MFKNISSHKYLLFSGLFVLSAIVVNSELVSRLCSFELLCLCIILGKREKMVLNPYFLFALTPLTLASYVGISEIYMPSLSNKTYILALINIYAFIFALYFTKPFHNLKNCIGLENNRQLRYHAIILFVFSFASIVVPALSAVLWLFRLAAYACIIRSRDKKMLLLIFVYMAVEMASGGMSKMGVLLDMLTISICFFKYYKITSDQKLKILSFTIVGIVAMFFSFMFATKGDGKKDLNDVRDQVMRYERVGGFSWNYAASFFLPYMYLETAWYNVEHVMETDNSRTFGLWVAKPILGYFGFDEHFEKEYELESNSSFNTFTFVTTGFKDFGYWLSILSPLLLGFFVKKIYTRFLVSNSPFDVSCYVAVSLATFQMYFSNHFFMQSYPFTIVIIMELYKKFFALPLGGKVDLENK